MRLHFGLLNEDLADRFYILHIHRSNIFKTWMQLLCKTVRMLVVWLPKESIKGNDAESFKTTGHKTLQCLVDCSEVSIERPRNT